MTLRLLTPPDPSADIVVEPGTVQIPVTARWRAETDALAAELAERCRRQWPTAAVLQDGDEVWCIIKATARCALR